MALEGVFCVENNKSQKFKLFYGTLPKLNIRFISLSN